VILAEAAKGKEPDDPLFITRTGKRVGARKLSGDHFQRLIKKAGIPRIKFHDMRHTFASWYMIEVGDIWNLMGILGHSSVKTTMRYAHLSNSHQKMPSFNWHQEEKVIVFPKKTCYPIEDC
jgi:integrase